MIFYHLSHALSAAILLGVTANGSVIQDCLSACAQTEACSADPHSHSSYCKFWLDKSVCFGLYWRSDNSTEMCFYPNDVSCSQNLPVLCNETPAINSTSLAPSGSVRTSTIPTQSTAQSTTVSTSSLPSTTTSVTTTRPITTTSSTQTSTLPPTTSANASTTTTSTKPSTSLSGRYCGKSTQTNLIGIQLNFNPTTVDVTLSDYLNGSISNVPYNYDSSSGLVTISSTPAYVGFLNSLPLFLVPQDIVVRYTASTDQVTVTVLGVIIPATHAQCDAR
jgi:hypothetical protein